MKAAPILAGTLFSPVCSGSSSGVVVERICATNDRIPRSLFESEQVLEVALGSSRPAAAPLKKFTGCRLPANILKYRSHDNDSVVPRFYQFLDVNLHIMPLQGQNPGLHLFREIPGGQFSTISL